MQIQVKCVSAHKVMDGQTAVFDATFLVGAASGQPSPSAFVDKGRGKIEFQRLAGVNGANPFVVDQEYVLTIAEVPPAQAPPAPAAVPAAPAPTPPPAPAPTAQAPAPKPPAAAPAPTK